MRGAADYNRSSDLHLLGLTVRKENRANINTTSKNAVNPKEDAKLLQSRLSFQWPILEFVFSWNGLSPAIFQRLKNPTVEESKEEKAAISTSMLELCFSLFILPPITPYSLPVVEDSLNFLELVSTIFERDEGQQKKEERKEKRERKKETEKAHQGKLHFHIIYPTRKHML